MTHNFNSFIVEHSDNMAPPGERVDVNEAPGKQFSAG